MSKEKPFGRPTDFTPELAKRICDLVATHTLGYPAIQKLYPDLPTPDTVNLWRFHNKDFSDSYIKAKRFQSDLMVEEMDYAIEEKLNYYNDQQGNQRIDAPSSAIAIARMNNRKWVAAKLMPKLYGDPEELNGTKEENAQLKEELQELRTKLNKKNKKDY